MELVRLRWEDVDFDRHEITLRTRKVKHGHFVSGTIPMIEELFEALMEHRRTTTHDHVFISIKTGEPYTTNHHWLKRLCERAEVSYFSYHPIRHLTATVLAKNGVPAVTISQILRHRNVRTTEIYIHRTGDMKNALNCLKKMGKAS